MGRKRRVRQHVNPLGLRYAAPRAEPLPELAQIGPDVPVDVELGCADGQFSFELARAHPERFVVGLDIREKIIDRNRRRARLEGLGNVAFGYVNINVDLDRVFASGAVDRFHLLFPDPWFKSRHHKRRVVDPWALAVMRRQLRPGGELHIASDVYEVALEALAELEDPELMHLGFRNLAGAWSFWRANPFGASSRREQTTLARGQRVWRMRYGVTSESAVGSARAPEIASHRT
jgi:tRNA (guanine-N7-)-methyltransferase